MWYNRPTRCQGQLQFSIITVFSLVWANSERQYYIKCDHCTITGNSCILLSPSVIYRTLQSLHILSRLTFYLFYFEGHFMEVCIFLSNWLWLIKHTLGKTKLKKKKKGFFNCPVFYCNCQTFYFSEFKHSMQWSLRTDTLNIVKSRDSVFSSVG